MADAPIQQKSRELFEKLGVEFVRQDIAMGAVIPPGRIRGEAVDWLAEQIVIQKKKDNRRFILMLILTAIAAVAACIAAWPVLKN